MAENDHQIVSPAAATALQIEAKHQQEVQPWQYVVSMPQPENHLIRVQLTISDWQEKYLDLHLPVWSPGSYLVREYAKNLQGFKATDELGNPLAWQKKSKNHWRIAKAETKAEAKTQTGGAIQISYQIFANELTVRTNHMDGTHGFFNGAATFMFVPGYESHPWTVEILLPRREWAIATALPAVVDRANTFYANDFDTLADSPFEVGLHSRHEFSVRDIPHDLIIWGEGNPNPEQIIKDITKIIEVEADLFGSLPYDRYLFLLHLSTNVNGGLEHKNCCTLNFSRLGFRKEAYLKFLNLVSHEFFHTWNVKRLRPKALEKFDYDQENYTPSLWFSEGTTSYYDQLITLRAGLYDAKHYLKLVGDSITRLQTTPGRFVQTLSESSWDTWIKLYRPEANSQNTQISYYLKGELVSMLLDLLIRNQTANQRSLDDVMRLMWQYFGKSETGFTESELYAVAESVAGRDLQPFFRNHLHTTNELDYNYYLEPFGLCVQPVPKDYPPYIGMAVKTVHGLTTVKSVDSNSPAQMAGINSGHELLAINGIRVSAESFVDRLQEFEPDDVIELSLFNQDRLYNTHLVLQEPVCDRYAIVSVANPTPVQDEYLRAWLSGA